MGKSTINPAVVRKHSTDIAALKNDLGIVEDGDTATHTIAQGQHVIWQGALYTADAAIASGTTLAASGGNKNLTVVENGGLNALNSNITGINNRFKTITSGSLYNITTSGIYYLTGAVTDKPTGNGGIYITACFNADLIVGLYCSTDGYAFSVIHTNNNWYTYRIANA